MLSFTRSTARRIRLLARKGLAGRPRGPSPPVWICPHENGFTLAVAQEEVIVTQQLHGASKLKTPLPLPMDLIEAVEGAGEELVEIEIHGKIAVIVRWTDRGLPRTQNYDIANSKPRFEIPPQPKSSAPVPTEFLRALHEAGRSAARDAMRYALQRIQIRGRSGEVIGTDSQFVYRHEGFRLPFKEDILVPAVPLFGLPELAKAEIIRIGKTEKHLVITADAVTVFLLIDAVGRYPDVASITPKTLTPATLVIDPEDALVLLDALPTLPGQDDEHQPVTIDLVTGPIGVVRAKAEKSTDTVEVHLPRSSVKSGPIRVALNRRYLIRMLTLGCRTFRVIAEHRPVVAMGESITTLVMPVDSELIVPPSPHARVLTPESPLTPIRSPAMKTSEPISNGIPDSDVGDPLVEVEALRNALGEAQHRLGRLHAALRSKKKEQKALNQVWSSLKSLNLGG